MSNYPYETERAWVNLRTALRGIGGPGVNQSINQSIKFIKQKDHEATYSASNKQQLAINFTVHKNIVIHLHKINFTKLN